MQAWRLWKCGLRHSSFNVPPSAGHSFGRRHTRVLHLVDDIARSRRRICLRVTGVILKWCDAEYYQMVERETL